MIGLPVDGAVPATARSLHFVPSSSDVPCCSLFRGFLVVPCFLGVLCFLQPFDLVFSRNFPSSRHIGHITYRYVYVYLHSTCVPTRPTERGQNQARPCQPNTTQHTTDPYTGDPIHTYATQRQHSTGVVDDCTDWGGSWPRSTTLGISTSCVFRTLATWSACHVRAF